MVVGIVFFSRRFKCYEYVASVLLVIGLLFLALGGQSTMDVSLSMTGFAFIFTSLLADSVSGNIQDVILRDFRDSPSTLVSDAKTPSCVPPTHVCFQLTVIHPTFWSMICFLVQQVFFSYSLGTLILFAINVLSNELSEGFRFCQQNPSIYFFIVVSDLFLVVSCRCSASKLKCHIGGRLLSPLGWLADNCVFVFVQLFGALGYATSTIFAYMIQESGIILSITLTTFRKCLSIILSFVVFPKPFSFYHFLVCVILLPALYHTPLTCTCRRSPGSCVS